MSTENYNEITAYILGILENPNTPTGLYNLIARGIDDLSEQTRVNLDTPELLKVALPLMFARLDGKSDEPEWSTNVAKAAFADEQLKPADEAGGDEAPDPLTTPLTIEETNKIIRRIVQTDDDEEIRLLVRLIYGLAYTKDYVARVDLAMIASERAYTLTRHFQTAHDGFAGRKV